MKKPLRTEFINPVPDFPPDRVFFAVLLFVILFLAAAVVAVFGIEDSSPPPKWPDILEHEKGLKEDPPGSNWGPAVSKYLCAAGLDYPAPWCAAFACWGLREAEILTPQNNPSGTDFKPLAYVPTWDRPERRAGGPSRGVCGLIWFPSMKRYAHIFTVSQVTGRRQVLTIEGNTDPTGGREGDGVYARVRGVEGVRWVDWSR